MTALRPHVGREDGFTLMELVIVTIILGILAGIAIAVFLSQREKAYRSSAISTLRNLSTVSQAYFGETNGTWPGAAQLALDAPNYTFLDATTGSTSTDEVSVGFVDPSDHGAGIVFAVQGGPRCFYLRFGQTPNDESKHREPRDSVDCSASEFDDPLTDPGTEW